MLIFTKATYGTSESYIDVTHLVKKYFIINDGLQIPNNCNFNNYFGDPCVGKLKYLRILKDKRIIYECKERGATGYRTNNLSRYTTQVSPNKIIRVQHNHGFFSCCSVRLDNVVKYFNKYKELPKKVDSSKSYGWYKNSRKGDITFDYFRHYDLVEKDILWQGKLVDFTHRKQFTDYAVLNYKTITPFINKYFSPADEICEMIAKIEHKYQIDYDNTCVVFHRGNDKAIETRISSHDDKLKRAQQLQELHSELNFIVQSDETEFIEKMLHNFGDSCNYFKDEIRHMKSCRSTVDKVYKGSNLIFSKLYLAITIVMSKCRHIICSSGNCDMWIMLYRGNANGVQQYLSTKTSAKWV